MKKKLFTFLLSVTVLSSALSIPSFAAEDSASLSADAREYIEDTSDQEFVSSHSDSDNEATEVETTLSDNPTVTLTPTPTVPPDLADSDTAIPTPTPVTDIPDTDITDPLPGSDTDSDPNTPQPNPEIPDSSSDTPTATPTPAPLKLTYTSSSLKWENHSTVSLKMTADGACKWYYFFVDANADTSTIQAMYVASHATNAATANQEFSVTASNVPETDSWLVICAKPDNGAKAKMSVIKLNNSSFKKKRPSATPSVTPRAAHKSDINQSTVSGLENALKFFPGKFYDFSVTGAGQDIKDPIEGDTRWIPAYWSTNQNPAASQQNNTWAVGSDKGIRHSGTYDIYIFLKKQTYNGKDWQDTDVIQSIISHYTAASISASEWNKYLAQNNSASLQMKVNTRSITLRTGQSTSAVKVTNANAYFRVVAWYSDDTTIAKVNSSGKITAGKKTGKTHITVVMNTGEATKIKVTVQSTSVKTTSITGLKKKVSVEKGKTVKLKPVLNPITSQDPIKYSSSNPKIASVSSKGVIKGLKGGTAKITVKSGNKKFIVTVTVPKTATEKITGIKSELTLKKGKTSKLKPKKAPSNSDDKISYSSSNKKVATVNARGIITAQKKGSTVITIKSGKSKITCKVTVK